jgi:hypothetical protein
MLDKEFQYYLNNQKELVKTYNNKFIAIKDQVVIGAYDSHLDAYNETAKKHAVGTFLIQHCVPGESGYTQTFHSRVLIHSVRA